MDIIEKLPEELILKVLKSIGIDDIITLGNSTSSVLLKKTIISYFSKLSVCVNNRIKNLTHLGMYILTKSYLSKGKLQLIHDFKLLFELFRLNEATGSTLHQEITITYYIWDLVDFNQFLNMVLSLKGFGQMTFNLELEFDPSILGIINLNFLFEILNHLNLLKSITSLSLTNFLGDFDFDCTKFVSLKRFWVINSDIKFSTPLSQSQSLQDINIFPNVYGYNRNRWINLKSLPPNVNNLTLGHVILRGFSSYPSSLKCIKLKYVKDLTEGKTMLNLIKANTHSKSLKKLFINDLINVSDEINLELVEEIRSYESSLIELSIQNYFNNNNDAYDVNGNHNLENLVSLRLSNSVFSSCNSDSFNKVVKLNITNNNMKNIGNILKNQVLKELYISYNPIDWSQDIKWPPHLIRLELRNTGLGENLHKLQFPDSIKILGLEVNDIRSVENFKFPKNLTNLGLGSNRIEYIKNHYLPSKLEILHLTENLIKEPIDFRYNADGEKLQLISLYINSNSFNSLKGFKFPETIGAINFDDNHLKVCKDLEFPDSLFELSLVGCSLSEVDFKSKNLNLLNLSNNNLKSIKNLPKSINQLIMKFNKFERLDFKKFHEFTQLKYLTLGNNKLKKAKFTFNHALTNLDLSNNVIDELELDFGKQEVSTNLMSINLSGNKLKSLTSKDLGHKFPVAHNNLSEIDISDNLIKEKDIQLNSFPPNLKVFIIGHTGYQDQFGYNIGKNIIANPLCTGKRIES